MQGQGDAALSWEGLRAQWKGQGLDFDYFLGRDFSKFPANSFVIRRADFEDPAKKELYEAYLRAWAMGLEFGHLNPRAATHIVLEQFPALASTLAPPVATESMMELANVFRGDLAKREGWGWHDFEQLAAVLRHDPARSARSASRSRPRTCSPTTTSPAANDFDHAKVKADADGYELPEEFEAIDVEAIRAHHYDPTAGYPRPRSILPQARYGRASGSFAAWEPRHDAWLQTQPDPFASEDHQACLGSGKHARSNLRIPGGERARRAARVAGCPAARRRKPSFNSSRRWLSARARASAPPSSPKIAPDQLPPTDRVADLVSDAAEEGVTLQWPNLANSRPGTSLISARGSQCLGGVVQAGDELPHHFDANLRELRNQVEEAILR